jgi:2-keto-4-pentenoate hydratase
MAYPQTASNLAKVASVIVQARHNRSALQAFPGEVPGNLLEAYRLQDQVLALRNSEIAGWKIGTVADSYAPNFGARFVGPVLAAGVVCLGEDDAAVSLERTQGWLWAVEAEFAFKLKEDLSPKAAGYSRSEVANSIGAMHTCIEVLGSPVRNLVELGPGAVIVDHGLNAGLIVGRPIPDWQIAAERGMHTRITVGSGPSQDGNTGVVANGLLGSATFCINELSRRGRTVQRNGWICTGATSGLHRVLEDCRVIAEFFDYGDIQLEIASAGENRGTERRA